MAELVDALDSGSSGLIACGGSSPPFRTVTHRSTAGVTALLVIGLLVPLVLSAGCKTEEEKLRDETVAIHEQLLEILKDNVDKPDQIVQVLHKFEAESREKRQELKKAGLKRMEEMSDKKRASFIAENRKRHDKLSERFANAVKEYPAGVQAKIKQLVALIAFN